MLAIPPQDRGAALGRNHRIDRVLQHQHGIAGGKRDRTSRPAFADDRGDERHLDIEACLDGARDRPGLTARLGVDPGKGAVGIDKGQDRQGEALGKAHQPSRLAITFGLGHAEIVTQPPLGVGAFLGAKDQNAAPAEAADPADNRCILGKSAISGERHELGDQAAEIVEAMRPFRMPRYLDLLPRCQPRISLAQQPVGGVLEAADLVGNVDLAGRGKVAEFLDLALELGDRPFEIEKVTDHLRRASGCAVSTNLRSRSVSTCV